MPSSRVSIYFKKQIRIDHLNIPQRTMLALTNVGLSSRKQEIAQARNAIGGGALPLQKGYAIFKSNFTKKTQGVGRNKRDLNLTGAMMKEFLVRSVSNNKGEATFSTRKGRIKAKANNDKEEFISWSQKNAEDVIRATPRVLEDLTRRMVLDTFVSGQSG